MLSHCFCIVTNFATGLVAQVVRLRNQRRCGNLGFLLQHVVKLFIRCLVRVYPRLQDRRERARQGLHLRILVLAAALATTFARELGDFGYHEAVEAEILLCAKAG